MIPQFSSTADMLGFLRALPQNANYVKMVKDDFGIDVPETAEKWQPEYFWKFGVQGIKNGLTGDELIKYAADSATNFVTKNPFQLVHDRFKTENADGTIKTGKAVRVAKPKIAGKLRDHVLALLTTDSVCTIQWDAKKVKQAGYLAGICVSTASTVDKVKALVTKNYNVKTFDVK